MDTLAKYLPFLIFSWAVVALLPAAANFAWAGSFVELPSSAASSSTKLGDSVRSHSKADGSRVSSESAQTPITGTSYGDEDLALTNPSAAGSSPNSEAAVSMPLGNFNSQHKTRYDLFGAIYYRGINGSFSKPADKGGAVDRIEATGVFLMSRFRHSFTPELTGNLKIAAIFESGSSRALFQEERRPIEGVFVDNAEVNYRPIHLFGFSAGALNQGFLENTLLAKDVTSPAVQQMIYLGPASRSAPWQLRFVTQQAAPQSTSLGTINEQDEGFAQLFTESAFLTVRMAERTYFKLRGTRWDFHNLTPAQASISQLRGNTTTADPAPNTRFVYNYAGWESGGELNVRLVRSLEVGSGMKYVINTEAPSGQNQGQLIFGQIRGRISQHMELTGRGEGFINQADSSPGFFNDTSLPFYYGNNNRQGGAGQLRLRFLESNFGLRAAYIDSRLIDPNPFQRDERTVILQIETLYELI